MANTISFNKYANGLVSGPIESGNRGPKYLFVDNSALPDGIIFACANPGKQLLFCDESQFQENLLLQPYATYAEHTIVLPLPQGFKLYKYTGSCGLEVENQFAKKTRITKISIAGLLSYP